MQRDLRDEWMECGREGYRDTAQAAADQVDLAVPMGLEEIEHAQEIMHAAATVGFAQHQAVVGVHAITPR